MKKTLALLLALAMVFALAACGQTSAPAQTDTAPAASTGTPAASSSGEPAAEPTTSDTTPLVVGYSNFNSKFSPFFAESAYDMDVQQMTQVPLLTSDRTGAVIQKGIEGETIEFNGTPYTYYGPADLTITENDDGSVYYDFTLRKDLVFSDGEPITVDDIIFSMYVLSDPTYDGSSTLYAQPILGMAEYRSGMDSRGNVIFAAGPDGYEENDLFTEEQYNAFWEYYNGQAGVDLAQEIVDYCLANYAAYGAEDVATSAALWGFEIDADATAEDFWNAILEAYDGDADAAEATESAGGSRLGFTIAGIGAEMQAGVTTGESASKIEGIQKIDDYNLRVVLTKVDATAIYQLTLNVAPLHYYGDDSLFDYDNDMFGFNKGDLSGVRSKTTKPMGAGPYKFIDFKDGRVYFEANESYFKGAPKIKNLQFLEVAADQDKLNGIPTGTIDIGDPSFTNENIAAIMATNSNGELTGDIITTNTVDNLGYGYIGQNALNMCIDNEPASDASKALRKAFGTIFSVYREVAIDSYYGDRASVINYPISNTSWAAPRPADDGYKVAFSVDVDGNDIYTAGMTAEEKYEAALQAALGWFEKAGYTVKDGKLTAAPKGAKLEYTFWIPGDGIGDHPAFMIVNEAKNALATIGITLTIKDLSNSSELWDNLDAKQVDMWAAAWGATVDPDMYQIYYSDIANGPVNNEPKKNPLGGPDQGGSNYEYCIADPELDELILAARASTDQAYRKAMYKACLDIIIDWATEIPTYQRQNAVLFSTERVNMATMTPDITTFYGWAQEIENVELN